MVASDNSRPQEVCGGELESRLVCAGCGAVLDRSTPLPFRCPEASARPEIDHVVRVKIADDGLRDIFLAAAASDERSPFLRFRRLMHSYRLARRQGMGDADYVELASGLDRAVAEVDGVGFVQTPYGYNPGLDLWIKDETGNVSGSHKARHLMGVAIHMEVVSRLGLVDLHDRELAIASCGNAALAASIVAKAAGRRLRVFVPPSAKPSVLGRLRELGAVIEVCPRRPEDPPGDPCYHRFREALDRGALPFSCQGPDNGLTIQGGMTLGWELALQHRAQSPEPLGQLFVQVGGGALASGVSQGLALAERAGIVPAQPRLFAVQTANAHPLYRSFERVRELARTTGAAAALATALRHRRDFMSPWPEAPESVADGILDDETYDWASIVETLLATGGEVVLAEEDTLLRACAAVQREQGVLACVTGTSGIAGVLTRRAAGVDDPGVQKAALVTGVRR